MRAALSLAVMTERWRQERGVDIGVLNERMRCLVCMGELRYRAVRADREGSILRGWACNSCSLLWDFSGIKATPLEGE